MPLHRSAKETFVPAETPLEKRTFTNFRPPSIFASSIRSFSMIAFSLSDWFVNFTDRSCGQFIDYEDMTRPRRRLRGMHLQIFHYSSRLSSLSDRATINRTGISPA